MYGRQREFTYTDFGIVISGEFGSGLVGVGYHGHRNVDGQIKGEKTCEK